MHCRSSLIVVSCVLVATACTRSTGKVSNPQPTTTAPTTQPKADNDWLNRTYQLSCDDISDKPIPVTLQNGQGTAGPNNGYDRWEVAIDARAAGSFDGLGSGTAVMFSCSPQPSNFVLQEVQIFHEDGNYVGRLRPLNPLPSGLSLPPVYNHDAFSVHNGLLNTGVWYYAGSDSHASGPSIPATLHWRWDGRQFVPNSQGQPSGRAEPCVLRSSWSCPPPPHG